MVEIIAHPFAMLVYGVLAHLLATLAEQSGKDGGPVHPVDFVRDRPYRTALGLVAGLAGYGALASTGQLTPLSAFGVGYMGPDALSKIAAAAGNKLSR